MSDLTLDQFHRAFSTEQMRRYGGGYVVIDRVIHAEKLAFNLKTAASLLSISYPTLWREIRRGKIRPLKSLKLITRKELLRYLEAEQLEPTSEAGGASKAVQFFGGMEKRKRKRFPRIQEPNRETRLR